MYKLILIAWIPVTSYHCLETPGGTLQKSATVLCVLQNSLSAKHVCGLPIQN